MTIATTSVQDPLAGFFSNLANCRNKTYLTHGLHPYPAKFIPHIPRELVAALALPGWPVLDPMCGSGTTLVEAALQGHTAIGIDINPIAVLAARAKTVLPCDALTRDIERLIEDLRARAEQPHRIRSTPPSFRNSTKWFADHVLRELAYVVHAIEGAEPCARAVALAAASAVVVGVSNQESETRWCAKANTVAPGHALTRIADKLHLALARLDEYGALGPASAEVHRADARSLPLRDASVGTIVTSPPYANSHDYYLYNKLRMFVLGYDVAPVQTGEIGSRNKHSDLKAPIGDYLSEMHEALIEWRRVLVPGGRAAVVVGDAVVRGELFDMATEFERIAAAAGFKPQRRYEFSHRVHNASFQRGFGTKLAKRTHVLLLA